MKISVDVYTKDVTAATAVFQSAIEAGSTDVTIRSNEDYETKEFEYVNLMFEVDHTSDVLAQLDVGPFVKDYNDL